MAPTLTYCTNLLPSETLEEVRAALARLFVPLRQRLGREVLPVGLYLSARAVAQLQDAAALARFEEELHAFGLQPVTLNAFPFGGFHGEEVKERVFRPTWEEAPRLDYTLQAARLLARWLPRGVAGAVSTHAGTFKAFGVSDEGDERIRRAWLRVAAEFARIEEESGKTVVLAVEPEPLSRLETTDETLVFFERLWSATLRRSAAEWSVSPLWLERVARRHVGVCFDVCHQAVEFEDCAASLARLRAAGITVGKVQASVAPALRDPAGDAAGRARLSAFAERRYLHQTLARNAAGALRTARDLHEALGDAAFLEGAVELRTHFHVPIFLDRIHGSLGTTRAELERVLAVCGELTPCVEIETYTLSALPDHPRDDAALLETTAREWEFARGLLGA